MISTIDRKRIFIFMAITYSISIALALVIFWDGGIFTGNPPKMRPQAFPWMTMLTFAPLVAHIATGLITHEGWSNILLRPNFRHGWRFYLAAWFLPILATILGGVIYYLLFPGRFDLSMSWAREVGLTTVEEAQDPGGFFITRVALALLLPFMSLSLLRCFGEEFGWRVYLLPKLMPLGARKAMLLVGAIWGMFHWLAIFMGYEYGFGYWGAPVVGPLLFLVMACFQSTFLAWVTLRSGSVWPATLAHAVTNALPLMVYFLRGEPDPLIGPLPVGIIGGLGFALQGLNLAVKQHSIFGFLGPNGAGKSTTIKILIFHDCGHNSFFPSTRTNERVGFWLGVLVWTPGEQWWHSHAIHHATSSNLDKRGTGDVLTLTLEEFMESKWFQRLGYKFFRHPLVMFGLGQLFMFFVAHRIPRPMFGKKQTVSLVWNNLAILVVAAGLSLLIGFKQYLMIQLPVIWIAGAIGIWLFYIQHQFEKDYWERDPEWNYVASALLGASFYKLPGILQWFSGNIGYHHIHHLSPRVPNYYLDQAHDSSPLIQKWARQIDLGEGFRSLRFKVWDEPIRRMRGFPRVETAVQEPNQQPGD